MFIPSFLSSEILELKFTNQSTAQDAKDFFHLMNDLLVKKSFFYIVLMTEGTSPFPDEERRQLGIWFKKNKELLGQQCLGMVRVMSKASLISKFSSKAMSLAMPFPYTVVREKELALRWIEKQR